MQLMGIKGFNFFVVVVMSCDKRQQIGFMLDTHSNTQMMEKHRIHFVTVTMDISHEL